MATSSKPEPAKAQPAATFLRSLHAELAHALVPEMELTMRVAVMHAAGYSRAQIVLELSASEIEVKMALVRLGRIAETWK